MIRQSFYVENYWKVIVYYNIDFDLFHIIGHELRDIGFSRKLVRMLYSDFMTGTAKAVTCSSLDECVSIVLFPRHRSKKDYINSIVHEAEHVKQAMLKAYHVTDAGEPPAYTIGYLVGRMYSAFKQFL